ncbi:MAG: AAA family ATPase [Candidatus Hodarchaeaceae archaeon]|nr:AAA family ATPase [Candidatus Hodarchaeaceae archaeon]
MITHVKLKNWKSHSNTELRFGDGTNVLVGIMGSGKTAILDGITYALFGTLPAVQSRRIKLEDLITSRPRPLDRAEVEVGFITPDGEEYLVKRVIERGTGTALSELRKASGELVESPSSSRVTEVIKSLLDLDYDLFERAIYSEQNRLDYFLTLQRGRRMESIDELLGINKLEKARKSVVALSNRAVERAEEREVMANQLRQDQSIALLPTHEQELKELEASKEETSMRLQQLQPELESTRAQVQEFRKTEQELAQLEQSRRGLEGAIGALKNQIEQIRERLGAAASATVEEIQKQVGELERAYSEKVSSANRLSSDLTAASSRLQSLETRKAMLQEGINSIAAEREQRLRLREELEALKPEELAKEVERLQTEFRSTGNELAALRARIQDLRQSIDELAAAGATCPVCESPLEEARKQELLQQRQGQLDDFTKRAGELEYRLKELDETLDQKLKLQQKSTALEREVKEIPKLEDEQSNLFKQLQKVEFEIPKARSDREKLKSDAERAREEADEFHEKLSSSKQTLQLRFDLSRLDLEYKQKLEESARVQQALEQLKLTYDEIKAEGLRKRLEELVGAHERLRAELSGKEQLLAEKRRFVESVREKLALISRYEAEVKHLREAAQALTTIQTALTRTQTSMRRMFIDGVNEVMSDLWESIYPYGDFVGIQLGVEGGERGGDYVLQLRDRSGNWISVEGIASGGERTDACLALRIAFSIVLAPNLKWIVFDEPTHNLDSEGIQELAKILRDRLPEVVKQIIIITHEERLESAVSGYLYRFYRNKAADEPTRVEQVTVPELFE